MVKHVLGRNLNKAFIGGKVDVEPIVDVSFEAVKGKLTVFTGPSGSGKTIVMNIIAGFIKPDGGQLLFDGSDASQWGWHRWNRFRRDFISYSPQRNMFLPRLKAIDNILLSASLRGVDLNRAKDYALKLSAELNMDKVLDMEVYKLSGGERRRLSFIRSLLVDVDIYLFDEPTSNLDIENAKKIIDKICELVDKEKIVIVATHDENLVRRGELKYIVKDGRSIHV